MKRFASCGKQQALWIYVGIATTLFILWLGK